MYHIIVLLTRPYTLLFLLAALALANLWRQRSETRRRLLWLTVPLVLLILLSTPAVAHLALGTLEWRYPRLVEKPADAEAIVVLSGYVPPQDEDKDEAELGEDTLYRCLHALRLYQQNPPCPIVVSGGKVDPDLPGPPCADVMRKFLIQHGVRPSDILAESVSRTTYENAVECRKLLEQRHLHRIVLVTEALHMFRALGCFRRQGIDAVPSACRFRAAKFYPSLAAFLPNPAAAKNCELVAHEWLGAAWYWLKGRM